MLSIYNENKITVRWILLYKTQAHHSILFFVQKKMSWSSLCIAPGTFGSWSCRDFQATIAVKCVGGTAEVNHRSEMGFARDILEK